MSDVLFESERLYYREPTLGDVIELHEESQKVWPDLRHWMVWTEMEVYTLEHAHQFVTEFAKEQREKGGIIFFGFDKNNDNLVISSGLNASDKENIFFTGYWVTKDYLGKGYATETTKAVLKYGFERHGADIIKLSYYEGNEKSRRVIEKCGFEFIKTLPKEHKSFLTGEMMDEHLYSITKDRWKAQ